MTVRRKGTIIATCICACGLILGYYWSIPRKNFRPSLKKLYTYTVIPLNNSDNQHAIPVRKFIEQYMHTNFKPTKITIRKKQTHEIIKTALIMPGIQHNLSALFIVSCGYKGYDNIANGSCILTAYKYLRDMIITSPCITFDYPDGRKYSNFGQSLDEKCLELIYTKTSERNPTTDIVLIGECRGTQTILKLASKKLPNIKALILESPMISVKSVTKHLTNNYVRWLPYGHKIAHRLLTWIYPNYKEHEDDITPYLPQIPANLPILIVHAKNDKFVATSKVNKLIADLHASGHDNVYYLLIEDEEAKHAALTYNLQFQYIAHAFLKKYNLPHDEEQAIGGKELLEQCKITTL